MIGERITWVSLGTNETLEIFCHELRHHDKDLDEMYQKFREAYDVYAFNEPGQFNGRFGEFLVRAIAREVVASEFLQVEFPEVHDLYETPNYILYGNNGSISVRDRETGKDVGDIDLLIIADRMPVAIEIKTGYIERGGLLSWEVLRAVAEYYSHLEDPGYVAVTLMDNKYLSRPRIDFIERNGGHIVTLPYTRDEFQDYTRRKFAATRGVKGLIGRTFRNASRLYRSLTDRVP